MSDLVDDILGSQLAQQELENMDYQQELEEFYKDFLSKEPFIASLIEQQPDYIKNDLIPSIVKTAYFRAQNG